jgi:hypothetical protein
MPPAAIRRSVFMEKRIGVDSLDDQAFLREFEARRWPLDRWHHRDHVKLAYLYLRRYPFDDALERIRVGIKAHNAAHDVPDLPTRGYHETMTCAWLHLVDFFMCEDGPATNADGFVDQHPQLSEQKTLGLFFSPERLMSAEAKVSFVEPDLRPLPRSHRSDGTA